MQCYVPVAVLSPPMCEVTDGYSLSSMESLRSVLLLEMRKKNFKNNV